MNNKKIKLYRPSNSTEGQRFWSNWCAECAHDRVMNGSVTSDNCTDEDLCQIINDSMIYTINDPEYPNVWRYDENGSPVCTAFISKDEPIPTPRDDKTIDMFENLTGENND